MTERADETRQQDAKARNVTSLAQLGFAAAKAAASLVAVPYGPLGAFSVESLKIIVDHIHRYREDQVQHRLAAFARVILETNLTDVPEDLFEREIDQTDFHAVITALINDEDDEKAALYAQTLKTLLAQEVPNHYRRYIIRTVRALTWTELELARRLYIHHHFRFPTYNASPSDPAEQVSRLLARPDALQRVALQSLRSHALLADSPANPAGAPRGQALAPTPQPTELLETIVTAAYPAAALLPAALGFRERSPIADLLGVFFAFHIEEDEGDLISRLHEELFNNEIASLLVNPSVGHGSPRWQLRRAAIIALGLSKSGSPVAAVRAHVDLATKNVAVILLPGATDDPTIERAYTLDLRSGRIDDPDPLKRVPEHLEQISLRCCSSAIHSGKSCIPKRMPTRSH